MSREKAVGYGYVIADPQGRIQLDTLRSNRSESWKAFVSTEEGRKKWKKCGFRCVPVWINEHVEAGR